MFPIVPEARGKLANTIVELVNISRTGALIRRMKLDQRGCATSTSIERRPSARGESEQQLQAVLDHSPR
jgi:hypothetical protein